MDLRELCFVLPTETDELDHELEREVIPESKSPNRSCGGSILGFARESFHRVLESKWVAFCTQQLQKRGFSASAVFHDTQGVQVLETGLGENPRIFSYSELYIGSNGFSPKEVLGSGGFGRVYRAVLPSDGTVVAVKCLAERGERFEKTFMAELVAVAHLRHRNLVRLRGWCIHEEELLLVYDYMPNRSLDRVLFKRPENASAAPLSWDRRKRIIHGLAAALNYLHEQLETQIIHRDVKASNVMLDSHFNARLGDFGLARWLEHEVDYEPKSPPILTNRRFRLAETTRVGGTIGYLPPESFHKRSAATAKSDVFSFGIVVLELVSGRRAVDLAFPDDQIVLLDWMRRLSDEGSLLEARDSRLRDRDHNLSDMERCIKIGLMCTLQDPRTRPSMKWIMEVLSGSLHGNLPDLPSFQSYPLYISSSSTDDTSATKSSGATSVSTAALPASSSFFSANAETIYITAESMNGCAIRLANKRSPSKVFPVVETPRTISYEEILTATKNFSDSRRVAEVDFGTAYHGFLENRHVLVKRLGMKKCPVLRMRFANEFQNLGRLRHRNLIQLRGWCTEQNEMLVVYDYTAAGLLSHILFHHRHKTSHSILTWNQRYNIIKALASAIYYLHEEWEEQVIHRNITSSAVILDPDMNPKLSSFALAEFLTRKEHDHHVDVDKKTSVRGIFGYMSPEYMDSGEATTMADVYSFGVVVLEVVSGQRAVDFRRKDAMLVERARKFEWRKKGFHDFVDWKMGGNYCAKEMERVMKLGMECTRSEASLRPDMRQIVSILDGNDGRFVDRVVEKEKREEWKRRNSSALSHITRIKALGIM